VFAESSAQQLSVAQEKFLGISLMLLRAPALVRSRGFIREVELWHPGFLTATDFVDDTEPESTANRSSAKASRNSRDARPTSLTATRGFTENPRLQHDATSQRTHVDAADRRIFAQEIRTPLRMTEQSYLVDRSPADLDHANAVHSDPTTVAEHSAFMVQATERKPMVLETGAESKEAHVQTGAPLNETKAPVNETVSPEVADQREPSEFVPGVGEVASEVEPIDLIAELESQFAGVFYLLNLSIYLGLYGDFTRPGEPGIELNIWDFVRLIGRELVGEAIERDPVWLLLAKLSGREVDLESSESADESCPGQLWLPELTTEHSDQIRHSNTKLQELQTWLAQLLPLVRHRLRLAFGLDRNTDPGPLLIDHVGRVRVTPTHVDVTFALAELPLVIRVAGLDRDPGWVPAAGRFVAFHFV
jgi:hypothetical protein